MIKLRNTIENANVTADPSALVIAPTFLTLKSNINIKKPTIKKIIKFINLFNLNLVLYFQNLYKKYMTLH